MARGSSLAPGGAEGRAIVTRQADGPEANAGLIWERYYPIWASARDILKGEEARAVMQAFAKRFRGDADKALTRKLSARAARQERALRNLADSRGLTLVVPEFKLAWRFATGLGSEHPTENGFAFDVPTGVPTIRGSAVKGLCRAAARMMERDRDGMKKLFGPEEISSVERGSRGGLLFFDAVPVSSLRLGVDIVNCHHSAYYGADPKKPVPPRETESPVPVHFLTVEKGAVFRFPIIARSESDAEEAAALLADGLDWLGIGAKTAVGYGIFKRQPGS